jgi:hypothetical protein
VETTIEYLQRKLSEVGPDAWESIAEAVSNGIDQRYKITRHTLRKIYYGERPNLGSAKADALRAYFQTREKGRGR